jgi:hypothetical protein
MWWVTDFLSGRVREESMFIWENNSNNRRLSAFQLEVGPMTFD